MQGERDGRHGNATSVCVAGLGHAMDGEARRRPRKTAKRDVDGKHLACGRACSSRPSRRRRPARDGESRMTEQQIRFAKETAV